MPDVDQDAGERAFRIVIKKRRVHKILAAEGTEPLNGVARIGDVSDDEEATFAQSNYGLRPIATIYETDTQGATANTCYIIIARKKVEVPCG